MDVQQFNIQFPAEWYPQSAVQLTWPHAGTDWAETLNEVMPCFKQIALEILKRQDLIVVCAEKEAVLEQLGTTHQGRLHLYELPSNDTWARDHGGLSVLANDRPTILDFTFNGWGEKFDASLDNRITSSLFEAHAFSETVQYKNEQPFVLEGGSVESDGKGVLLTTTQCLMAPHRNQPMDEAVIENHLKQTLGVSRILWLREGYLAGDDTDGHIDMLARFCDEETIAYVAAPTWEDEHTEALTAMERELKTFKTQSGKPYRLIPLPMATPVYHEGERLPASYANFLIMNGAVLLPIYGLETDQAAIDQLQSLFPNREIVPINCLPLIKQHGSLHCLTMQFPRGFVV
jgi:agmatine deiminase